MAVDETTAGVISAIIAGLALAIREAAAGIIRAIRGSTKVQQKKAEAEEAARHEEWERELAARETKLVLKAIDDLGAKVQRGNILAHENRERLVKVEAQHEAAIEQRQRLEQWAQNITEDMRVIKQRSTGKVD